MCLDVSCIGRCIDVYELPVHRVTLLLSYLAVQQWQQQLRQRTQSLLKEAKTKSLLSWLPANLAMLILTTTDWLCDDTLATAAHRSLHDCLQGALAL